MNTHTKTCGSCGSDQTYRDGRFLRCLKCEHRTELVAATNDNTKLIMAIVGSAAMIIVAMVTIIVVMERRDAYNAVFPGCWQLVGTDTECEARVSARILRGYRVY